MRLALLPLCVSLVSVGAAPSPGCQASLPEVPHPGRHHRFNVTVTDPVLGEVTRAYVLHLPAMYNTSNTQPTPLMMVTMFDAHSSIIILSLRISTAGAGLPMTRWSTCLGATSRTPTASPSSWSPWTG